MHDTWGLANEKIRVLANKEIQVFFWLINYIHRRCMILLASKSASRTPPFGIFGTDIILVEERRRDLDMFWHSYSMHFGCFAIMLHHVIVLERVVLLGVILKLGTPYIGSYFFEKTLYLFIFLYNFFISIYVFLYLIIHHISNLESEKWWSTDFENEYQFSECVFSEIICRHFLSQHRHTTRRNGPVATSRETETCKRTTCHEIEHTWTQ